MRFPMVIDFNQLIRLGCIYWKKNKFSIYELQTIVPTYPTVGGVLVGLGRINVMHRIDRQGPADHPWTSTDECEAMIGREEMVFK